MTPISRRDLVVGATGLGGGIVIGAAAFSQWGNSAPQVTPPPQVAADVTFEDWVASRKPPYYIAHRGAGGVLPEHTLPSYLKALEWGAQCLEISVVMSSDRVLYCLHDLTLDRTTTLRGEVRTKTSNELDAARVVIPRLGPRWAGANMPPMPRVRDVLAEVGGKAVLCIEPKDDAAYPALIELIGDLGLESSVMIKLDGSSGRIAQAKGAGFPVFAYLGNAEVATVDEVHALAQRLDPQRDALVLPARDHFALMPEKLIRTAASTGIPVWVFPIHRREEVAYYSQLGVQGMITASVGYVSGSLPPVRSDDFPAGELTPGMLTRSPYTNAFSLDWVDDGALRIPTPGRQAFVAFAQFSPIQNTSYRISFDASFDPLPSDTWQHVSISFAHTDDQYYEHRLGAGDGYHALLRADGTMSAYAHFEGDPNGTELTTAQSSAPMKSGMWARLTLDVTPEGFQWSRDDGTTVKAQDTRFKGGYFHIGSSATNGSLRLRNLTVS